MNEGKLQESAVKFAIDIVNYYKWLVSEKKEFVMSKQILRSGTSIGANIYEANYAISKADFIAKLQIALKETSETEYWMIVLGQTGFNDSLFQKRKENLLAIKRMLIASLNTSQK